MQCVWPVVTFTFGTVKVRDPNLPNAALDISVNLLQGFSARFAINTTGVVRESMHHSKILSTLTKRKAAVTNRINRHVGLANFRNYILNGTATTLILPVAQHDNNATCWQSFIA